jgi:hypothetical protein
MLMVMPQNDPIGVHAQISRLHVQHSTEPAHDQAGGGPAYIKQKKNVKVIAEDNGQSTVRLPRARFDLCMEWNGAPCCRSWLGR